MSSHRLKTIRDDYDRVALRYAEHFFDELKAKPLDRELLTRFAAIQEVIKPVEK